MEKFLTKENVVIVVAVFTMIIQSNYFATKIDIANLKLEIADIKADCIKYTDDKNTDLQNVINVRFDKLENKLDKYREAR